MICSYVVASCALISAMISAMRCSFLRMSSASCSGGRCSKSLAALGFLRSRFASPLFEQFGGGNFPGAVVLFALVPPVETVGEFFELDRLGLGVVLPAFGQRLLVVPDFLGRAGAVEEEQVGRDARVGREDAVGQADDGVEVELLEQFFLDAGADAVAEERAVGHDDGGSAWFRRALELAHDELEEQQRGLGGLLVFGEVAEDAALFFAAEGRVGQDDIDAVSVADLAQREAQAVQRIDLRATRGRAGADSSARADTAAAWPRRRRCSGLAGSRRSSTVLHCFSRCLNASTRKPPVPQAGSRIISPSCGFDDFDHEADDGARRVELAGVAGGVAHLLEHRLVEMAEGVDLVAAGEVDAADLVDHVAQQVAVDHAVDRAFETRWRSRRAGRRRWRLAGRAGRRTDPGPCVPSGRTASSLFTKAISSSPVMPSGFAAQSRQRYGGSIAGRKRLARQLRFLFANLLHVVEELQEHDPGEHRQPVEVAVEPLVLAHDVAARLHDGGKPLGGGEGL